MAPSRALLLLSPQIILPRSHRALALALVLAPHLRTQALTPCQRQHQHQRRLLTTPASSPAVDLQGNDLEPPDYLNEKELAVFEKLKRELRPEKLEVQDISGGCGSMYAINIVSAHFKGLSMIKQHRLVNGVLGEEIRGWHGVQLRTKAS